MEIRQVLPKVERFSKQLKEIKSNLAPPSFWYPYGSLSNFQILEQFLTGRNRDLAELAGGAPIADVGAADGDVAFFLESQGFTVDIVDNGPTNNNGLAGARKLKEALRSQVAIHEVDLDSQFQLPRKSYGLILFLGILYHLQNPFYALKELAKSTRYALISTRIARGTADRQVLFEQVPIAYLLGPTECNNDSTNYWIFSYAGLNRILERTNWEVLDAGRFGSTGYSDPASGDGDERAFLLVRSRVFGG
ncbi:MAG: methyltransferase domain-containing protein [Myxococcaceae bacterium]